ncbi:MAG: zinc-binding dehydrogenase [Acidimicrobiaceae bacterium]|nr:zinc-binding dehydrogenase [Acidimicrobiaceae bacterium]
MPTGRGATIRAAVSRGVGLPPSIEDLHLAAPGPDEVRVEVTACAVCHSDLSYLDGTWATEFPLVLGHEAAGRVLELGDEPTGDHPGGPAGNLAVGDPVVVTLVRTCGNCRACHRGHDVACTGDLALNDCSPLADADGNPIAQGLNVAGFAEQVVVHRSQVVRLPDDVDPLAASLLGCGVLTGSGAVTNTAGVAAGDAVVVVGCGGVGTGALQAARIVGADPIVAVDPSPDKRASALGFGATHAVDPVAEDVGAAITSATGGRLADHVLVTTGAPAALDGAIDLLAPMGNLVIVGMAGDDVTMEVAPSWLAAANKSILGSKMGTIRVADDVPALIGHHRDGRLDLQGMVSTTHGLDDIAEAFDEAWRGDVLRTVVLPNGEPAPC